MRSIIYTVLLTTVLITGCTSVPVVQQQTDTAIPGQADLPPISFFASYLSDSMQHACDNARQQYGDDACIEDPIDPTLYWQAFTESGRFNKVALSEDGFDYEVLLASKSTSDGDFAATLQNMMHHITFGAVDPVYQYLEAEISVTWRGIELGMVRYEGRLDPQDDNQQTLVAQQLVNRAISEFAQANVFSAEFLYSKLQASDYHQEMSLPQTIADFQMLDMQLFRDPFQGAMVRYWHPLYAEENIDVFVYPVAQQDLSDQDAILRGELMREQQDITLLAEARQVERLNIGEVQQLAWNEGNQQFSGLYQGVDADQDSETLYASTYLFLLEDKFVKVSANFPPHIATHLVKQVLPQIKVPGESRLMAQLRSGQS